jgi:uncharacterized iron-regulated membrane protein
MLRRILVFLHRWTGLLMTGFLLVVGLTGSLLAFNSELERVFASQLFATPRTAPPLDLATLAERAQAALPRGVKLRAVTFTEPDQAMVGFTPTTDATGQPVDPGFTQFFVDPWTGAELGRRRRGDLSEGAVNLMPFVYDLHWRLALGDIGMLTLGVVAIAWTIDCFVGFYLTLPVSLPAFWRRWGQAFRIKRGAGSYRLNFDLHRAGGLWLWPLLFVFAWSSVMFNMRPVYEFVTGALFDYRSPRSEFMALAARRPVQGVTQGEAQEQARLDWRAALAVGARLMAEQAAAHGVTIREPIGLTYVAKLSAYMYEARGSCDLFERAPKGGGTAVLFDGDSGALLRYSQPTGQHVGNTIESWLYALHMSRVFGRPYQIFICALGLGVAMLGVTGVYIWWRKRAARRHHRRKTALTPAAAQQCPAE